MAENQKRYSSTFTFEGRRYYCKGSSQREADQKAALRRADLQAGRAAASSRTVSSWWPEYLATYHARASEKTREDYGGIYRNAIAPYVGAMPLKSVRSADLQRALNSLSSRSESYAKKAILLIRGMFRAALDNELISKNPAQGLVLPKAQPETPRRVLTEDERAAFLEAAEKYAGAGIFLLIYHTGLRPSEAARVCAEDFDRQARTLRVRGSKTKAATRTVPVPAAYEIPEGKGRIFQKTTKFALRYWWAKVVAAAQLPADLTPYCLRHDYCTRLLDAGVPLDAASYIMGHSSLQITAKRYRHPTDQMVAHALAVFDAAR